MAEQPITFRNPPVVETVLGVQFDLLRDFSNAHLGAFWKWLQDRDPGGEWAHVVDAGPIAFSFEHFGDQRTWAEEFAASLRAAQEPAARLQIRSADGSAMVQVQNGRFHYNWIGRGDQDYPRYAVVRPRFDELRGQFAGFLATEGLGSMKPNQWEVTYVNRIPIGTVWHTPAELADVFRGLPGPWRASADVAFESCTGAWRFEIPPQRGRLHVEMKQVHASATNEPLIRLALTARGPANDDASLGAGLEIGHTAIVTTFAAVHSDTALKYWGKQP